MYLVILNGFQKYICLSTRQSNNNNVLRYKYIILYYIKKKLKLTRFLFQRFSAFRTIRSTLKYIFKYICKLYNMDLTSVYYHLERFFETDVYRKFVSQASESINFAFDYVSRAYKPGQVSVECFPLSCTHLKRA